MPTITPEVQTWIAGAVVWLLLWAIRKSPWAGNLDQWTGYITAAVLAGIGAFAVELKAPPFEVLVFIKAWITTWAAAVFAYNTQKRLLP